MAFTPSFDPAGAPDRAVEPRWGLGDAAVGWLLSYAATIIYGGILLLALGYQQGDEIPLTIQLLMQLPLWGGFIGVPLWAAAVKGNGWRRDFRVSWDGADDVRRAVVAFFVGIATQLIVVPIVSLPWVELLGRSTGELDDVARELADRADGTLGVVLLVVLVGIGAPIAEELFFRGLLYRSLEKRWNAWVAVVGSSVIFGATHFQLLQFAGLTAAGFVFAMLVKVTDRLVPAIVAHMAFNMTTVVLLLTVSS